jgi:zinc transport system permease protein
MLVGALASYLGVFVVQRGMAFLGSGLSHAAFGGVALGLLLGAQPLLVAVPFTVAIAIAMVWVREQAGLAGDTTIGIFFAVSMALGVVFLSLKDGYSADAFTYLFGSILSVSRSDLLVAGAVALGVLALGPLWGRWAYATFDRNLARADRLPVLAEDYILTVCLAVVTVVSMKLVGILLISAFLVLPPATARLAARTFAGMTLWSVGLGIATVAAGLFLSVETDLPSGATIILLQAALFFVALGWRRVMG